MKTSVLINLLKEFLETYGDREVILSSDSEGNSYSPLCNIWEGAYVANSRSSGEAFLDTLTEADKERGYTEEDVRTDGQKAIFFIPTR